MNNNLSALSDLRNRCYSLPCLLAAIVVAIGYSGCKKADDTEALEKQEEVAVSGPVPSLPIDRVIEGKDGRTLKVTIVKRTERHISIIRAKDQKTFELEILSLSEADRKFVNTIPISVVADPYITSRKKTLGRLGEEVNKYYEELSDGGLNKSQSSMMEGKIKRLESEIQSVERQIQEHQK